MGALGTVEDVKRAVYALRHNLLSIKLSRDLYLHPFRVDMLFVEYALDGQRGAVCRGVEHQLFGVHLFDLFMRRREVAVALHSDG